MRVDYHVWKPARYVRKWSKKKGPVMMYPTGYGQAAPRTKPLPPPALEPIPPRDGPRTDELLAVLPALERGEHRRPFQHMTVQPAVLSCTRCRDRASMRAAWGRGEYSPMVQMRVGLRRLLLRMLPFFTSSDMHLEEVCIAEFGNGDVWMGVYQDLHVPSERWTVTA